MVGYYDDSRITAQRCPVNCIDCLSQYDCRKCVEGYEFVVRDSACQPLLVSSGLSLIWWGVIGGVLLLAGVVAAVQLYRWREYRRWKARQ